MFSYFYFQNLKPYHRALITISIVALLILFWFMLIYLTIQKKIATQEARFTSEIKAQQLFLKCKEECKALNQSINKMKNYISSQTQKSAKRNAAQSDMASAIEYARQTGLTLKSCKNMEKEKNEHLFDKQPIFYEFNGNLQQAIHFCNKLKACGKLVECDELAISIAENNICDIRCLLGFIYPPAYL